MLERYSIRRPFILYAGTIRPQKNIPRLVEAFAVLRCEFENHPDYQRPSPGHHRRRAFRKPICAPRRHRHARGALSFVFWDSFPSKHLRCSTAQLLFSPSHRCMKASGWRRWRRWHAELPVVASNLPSLVEAVGDAAELVTPDNVFDIARGLRELLLNRERREHLCSAGLAHATRFSWEDTARDVLEVYSRNSRTIRK